MRNATTEIITVIDNATLELHYNCRTDQVVYSIADYAGNVIKRGRYDCILNSVLNISDLPRGMYVLCIIDGDSLTKARFTKG